MADAIAKTDKHAELIAGKPPRGTAKETCLAKDHAKDKALISAVNSTFVVLPKCWGEDRELWKAAFKRLDASYQK